MSDGRYMTEILSGTDFRCTRLGSVEVLTIYKLVAALLLFVLLVSLFFSIWTLDRGFEITDKSYNLLLAIYPAAFKIFVSASHWITSLLWAITGSLFWFRAVGLGIVLLGAFILALGAIRAAALCHIPLTSGLGGRLAVISSTLVVALHWDLYEVTVFFTPSYNLLATAASYSAIGLNFLASGREWGWRASALNLLAGSALGIVFLCKFPAGISVSLLSLAVLSVFGLSIREWVSGVALIFIGMSAAVLLLSLPQMAITVAFEQFRLGLSLYSSAVQEPVSVRLVRYANELLRHWILTITQFALPLASFVLYALSRSKIIALVGFAFLIAIIFFQGSALGGELHLTSQITSLAALMMMILLAAIPVWAHSIRAAAMSASLLILPYCISIGTSNPLPPQILVSLAPWGSLSAIFAYNRNWAGDRRMLAVVLCLIFVSVAASQVFTSGLFPAYHMTRPLSDQTEPVRVGALGVLRVDKAIRAFVTALTDAANNCQISPGRPFLGFYNIPGVALVIQAVPVSTPWLVAHEQAKSWLEVAPEATLRSAVVALQLLSDGSAPHVPQVLPNFPAHYRLCGTATYPYQQQKIQLWTPNT